MNQSKKVVTVTTIVMVVYISISFFSSEIELFFPKFKNINLLADIAYHPRKEANKQLQNFIPNTFSATNTFESYKKKGTIIGFNQDSIEPALPNVTQKLLQLEAGKPVKLRIAWFGDSQIEGDYMTQDLRKMLNNQFNLTGSVGFIPVNSVSQDFRATAIVNTSGYIKSNNFKQHTSNSHLFLSGYSFFGGDFRMNMLDKVKRDPQVPLQKWLLFGKGDTLRIAYNDSVFKAYPATKYFNKILLNSSTNQSVSVRVSSSRTPVYGISSETNSGIIIDNYSFRGITGIELKQISNALLTELSKENYYDLIVFQYGVNLMFKPEETHFAPYYKQMKSVVNKFKTAMPTTDFLMLSCSDRAFNYGGEWKTAVGIDSLVYNQAKIAFDTKIPFYNLYQSMGGNGTMVKYVDSLQYAGKDYIHFNVKGSKKVAYYIFKAMMNDYNKTKIKHKKEQAKAKADSIAKAKQKSKA